MRSFSTILATASLLAFTSALPEPIFGGRNANPVRGGTCMTQAEAQQVADNFQNLIADYSSTLANETLTVGYHDYSDSVTTLIDSGCTGPQPVSVTSPALHQRVPADERSLAGCRNLRLSCLLRGRPERAAGHSLPAAQRVVQLR